MASNAWPIHDARRQVPRYSVPAHLRCRETTLPTAGYSLDDRVQLGHPPGAGARDPPCHDAVVCENNGSVIDPLAEKCALRLEGVTGEFGVQEPH